MEPTSGVIGLNDRTSPVAVRARELWERPDRSGQDVDGGRAETVSVGQT